MLINKGKLGEDIAVSFLEEKGYTIIERNFKTKYGEIDIIAEKENYIVFVEVKYRNNPKFGLAEESIDFKKLRKIKMVGNFYLKKFYKKRKNPRIDVIAINDFDKLQINHYKNVDI